jgi:tetratricopeptide (TPR) repeat protein
VEKLALGLRERGIDPWWDKWEIGPRDNIVASINDGLEEADAGIIVFSRHSRDSRWVEAEVSYLTYARIQESKPLIPVVVGDDAWVPPLLRPLARRGVEELDAIADALHHRKAGPPAALGPEHGRVERVLITLSREPAGDTQVPIRVAVRAGDREYAVATHAELPHRLIEAQSAFLRGFRTMLHRSPVDAERASSETGIAELGRALREFCLPEDSGDVLANLADGCQVGTTVEVCFEASDAVLLALPFEALRLPDDRLLATHPAVVMMRRPSGVNAPAGAALAGPLKILVAVGAPDEGHSGGAVLDQERELQNILDAVAPAQRHENVEVRILEVGHPDVIGAAIAADAYHVLHLSCHGLPGALELEDEDGGAVRTTAEQLIAPIHRTGRPLPMVLLSSCHGGVHDGRMASFAESLLRAGVPSVLAMQTSVSDYYATRLARAFYENLALREFLLPSRALADARKTLERERLAAIQKGVPPQETQPEYATAGLFVAGEERPLANFALDKQPLRVRPVYEVSGPVPQLRVDDLIGRRNPLRQTLRTLREPAGRHAGVVLTGIGGVGKSAVAGRAMQRLSEDGWLVPAHAGRFDLARIAVALGAALLQSEREPMQKLGGLLCRSDLDDRVRLQFVAKALAEEQVLLVLDDFEQNLKPGGGAFLDADVGEYLGLLAGSAHKGRLLITSRYPVPGMEASLHRIPIGPLSLAESRKLVLRLPGLKDVESAKLAMVLRVIGGHPRMLEFLDAVLRGGQGRLPHVTEKLQKVLAESGIDLAHATGELDEGIHAALLLGARDVFLEELLGLARREGIDEALLQAATSNVPVTVPGVARMLADGDGGDAAAAERALERLEDLSLVYRFPDGAAWVHRWTAEGLAGLVDAAGHRERSKRAGRYRWWRVEHESHSLNDGIEAVRNFLTGQDFDRAAACAKACFAALRRFQQSMGIAALASEVLESLPESHPNFAAVADEEATAHLALGFTDRALSRYEELLRRQERLAEAEPDRADYQRVLSVSYSKVGDLYRALGQGEQARRAYQQDLAIAERLAQAEPDRAEYQRDLSASYDHVGDLYRSMGQGEQARHAYQQSLAIQKRLAELEPDRADYQRDLSVSYNKMGDLYRSMGQGEQARQAYQQSLAIRERLAEAEPDRADYQRDLSVSYERVGGQYRAQGQGEQARQAYQQSLAIAERLAEAEPDRADYQRDLSVSYEKVGDLYRALGQGEQARQAYQQSLAIRERLAQAEPDRADYQRDLSVSYNKVGDVYRALGQGEQARQAYQQALAIVERLAEAEPDRADYQRDLAVSLARVGTMVEPFDQRQLQRALSILESLQSSGRLSPVDEPLISHVRKLLGEGDLPSQ